MIPKIGDKIKYTKEFIEWASSLSPVNMPNFNFNRFGVDHIYIVEAIIIRETILIILDKGAAIPVDHNGVLVSYPNSPPIIELAVKKPVVVEIKKQSLSHVTKISKIDL